MVPVVTFCTQPYYWLLAPFAALFQKYYGRDRIICYGDHEWPDWIPDNVEFRPVPIINRGKHWNWADDFGNGIAAILGNIKEPVVLITLLDMWPRDHVRLDIVETLNQYLNERPEHVVRVLLGNDNNLPYDDTLLYESWNNTKLFSARPNHPNLGHHGGFLLLPSLWNRELTISLLQNENFWDWEITHRRKLIDRPELHCVWTNKKVYPFSHVCYRQHHMEVRLLPCYGFRDEDKELVKSLLPRQITVIEN